MNRFGAYLLILLILSCISGLIYTNLYAPYTGIDDAYIYFVYAKNISNGFGFVYNIGGERVEGFTSFLWLLIVSLNYFISDTFFPWALTIINLLLISFAIFRITEFIFTHFFSFKNYLSITLTIVYLFIIFGIKGYIDWTVFSLLETGLWSFELILISLYLIKYAAIGQTSKSNRFFFIALISLLVFTRPESLLWGIIFIFMEWFIIFNHQQNLKKAFRNSLTPIIVFFLSILVLITFRLKYFGYPLPNTYYAKVSSNLAFNIKEGFLYFIKFIYVYPIYFIPVFFAFLTLFINIKNIFSKKWDYKIEKNDLCQLVISVIIATSTIIPLSTGGDHFSMFRMYQPIIPIYILSIFNVPFFKRSLNKDGIFIKYKLLILFSFIPVIIFMNIPRYFAQNTSYLRDRTMTSLELGFGPTERNVKHSDTLNSFFNFTPKPSIGRITAGGYAYGYNGETIDLLGLNNTTMAHADKKKLGYKNHAGFDIETFYILHPDMLESEIIFDTITFKLPENNISFEDRFETLVLKNIYKDEKFKYSYKPVILSKKNINFSVFSYLRTDYIDTLKNKGYNIKELSRINTAQ